jgi:hypothetical protein
MKLEFNHVNFVDDGGLLAAEMVLTGGEIVALANSGRLRVGNARPDHDIVTLKSGKERYRRTTARQKDWTDELLSNTAVIGNLTFNLNPDETVFSVDEDGHRLVIESGGFDQEVDSATRTRSIIAAAESPAQTFDLDTRFAVRVWFANEEEEKKLFHIYNQRGERVNATVAKFQYQSTPHQRIARSLMVDSPHLGLENIEVQANAVSANSNKLTAFNTLSQAIEGFWSSDPVTEADQKEDVEFLISYWDELVANRPEFGRLNKDERQKLRGTSIAGTAVSIHGVVALADAMKVAGTPLTELSKLKSSVIVKDESGEESLVDFFDYENPLWTNLGILVSATDKDGNIKKTLRMSFQTRKAIGVALKAKLGI